MNVTIISVGGAGSNIGHDFKESYNTVAGVSSECRFVFLDTSKNNSHEGDDFYHVKSAEVTGDELSGGGGLKGKNVKHIRESVINLINKEEFHKKTSDMYIVLFSLGGATGSDAGPQIINHLMSHNCTVLGLVVGDTCDFNYSGNTHKTLITLNTVANKHKKPLPLVLVDNNISGASINKINEDLVTTLEAVVTFTSGAHKDLDDQDMRMFFHPNYKDIDTAPGIYEVRCGIGQCDEKAEAILLRSLCKDEDQKLKLVKSLQSKTGYNDGIEEPLFLLLTSSLTDYFKTVVEAKDSFNLKITKVDIPNDDNEFL